MKRQKVFGVGFHKTGTKTLAAALRHLGFTVAGPFGVDDPQIGRHAIEQGLIIASQYDAVQDNPWPLIYRELHSAYPHAKFVLTIRDTDEWIHSVTRHFGGASTPMREWIYGVGDPLGNEQLYRSVYERHNSDVKSYFADLPEQLLVFRLAEGDGWNELCGFVGRPVPAQPFPVRNVGRSRSLGRRVANRFRKAIG